MSEVKSVLQGEAVKMEWSGLMLGRGLRWLRREEKTQGKRLRERERGKRRNTKADRQAIKGMWMNCSFVATWFVCVCAHACTHTHCYLRAYFAAKVRKGTLIP